MWFLFSESHSHEEPSDKTHCLWTPCRMAAAAWTVGVIHIRQFFFYIFIYIFFSPGNGARIHRCHYPSAHVCLLPRRQDCILKVLDGYSFLSQVTLDALTIHIDPGWKCLSKPCFLGCFEILLQKAFFHRVEKHHLYSSFAVAFLPGIFLLSVNIGGEALTSSLLQMAFF